MGQSGNRMIRAEEIIKLTETSSKEVPKKIELDDDDIKIFEREINRISENKLSISVDKSNSQCNISLVIKLPTAWAGSRIADYFATDDFIDRFRGGSDYYLTDYLGKYTVVSNDSGIEAKFSNNHKISTFSVTHKQSLITISLQFDTSFILLYLNEKLTLGYKIGCLFKSFVGLMSTMKQMYLTDSKVEEIRSDFISSIKKKSALSLKEAKLSGGSRQEIALFYDVLLVDKSSISDDKDYKKLFVDEFKDKLLIPMKKLDGLCSYNYHSGEFMVPGTVVSIKIKLFGSFDLMSFSDRVFGELPNGVIRIVVFYGQVYELPFLPEFSMKDLADAIAEVFVGYNKLITYFKNKPVKKSNVDW